MVPALLLDEFCIPLEKGTFSVFGVQAAHIKRREGDLALVANRTGHFPEHASAVDVCIDISAGALLAQCMLLTSLQAESVCHTDVFKANWTAMQRHGLELHICFLNSMKAPHLALPFDVFQWANMNA